MKDTRKMLDSFSIEQLIGEAVLRGATIENVELWDSEGIKPLKFEMAASDFDVTYFWFIDVENQIAETYMRYPEDTLSYSVRLIYSKSTFYDFKNRIIYEE